MTDISPQFTLEGDDPLCALFGDAEPPPGVRIDSIAGTFSSPDTAGNTEIHLVDAVARPTMLCARTQTGETAYTSTVLLCKYGFPVYRFSVGNLEARLADLDKTASIRFGKNTSAANAVYINTLVFRTEEQMASAATSLFYTNPTGTAYVPFACAAPDASPPIVINRKPSTKDAQNWVGLVTCGVFPAKLDTEAFPFTDEARATMAAIMEFSWQNWADTRLQGVVGGVIDTLIAIEGLLEEKQETPVYACANLWLGERRTIEVATTLAVPHTDATRFGESMSKAVVHSRHITSTNSVQVDGFDSPHVLASIVDGSVHLEIKFGQALRAFRLPETSGMPVAELSLFTFVGDTKLRSVTPRQFRDMQLFGTPSAPGGPVKKKPRAKRSQSAKKA